MGATFIHDLRGGVIYTITPDYKLRSSLPVLNPNPAHCFFEYNYIGSPKSIVDGTSILSMRRALGTQLARELSIDADFVSYIPESPKDAAYAFSQERKIPFIETFYKIKDERSFQGSTQMARNQSIQANLFLIPDLLKNGNVRGKKGIWIDDSIIRGTVGKRASQLLREFAGAKEIHLASYTPKVGIIGLDGLPRGCDQG